MTTAVWRFRLVAACLMLVAAAFLQSPGETAADTKLDLTSNPIGFLERALTLWDPQGFFGQMQNQAYGYLFPMGPFFALGDLVSLPPWVVQRLWWGALLCIAFLGATRLTLLLSSTASREGGGPAAIRWAAIAAGLFYALAPRMLTTLGPISAEALPMALAPWVVVPLVLADRGRDVRRMAAASSLAVLGMGAVNAIAALAVLPLGVWWIATRSSHRSRTAIWWGSAVVLASLWWVVPLLILGRFSPPFLDWIEAAAVTTRPNDLGSVLRGTSHWVAYVLEPSGPVWPAGWSLVARPVIVLAVGLAVGVALLGLARRDLPERTFVVGSAAIGVALLSLGHTGPVQGLAADFVQDLLDGVLAPLRNVHKADPVLRLALALALAHALRSLLRDAVVLPATRWLRPAGLVTAGAVIAGSAWPLWSGSITDGRTHGGIPAYWEQAASWLNDRGSGRALVVPGSSFGVFIWGRPQDEPLQPVATSPWAVRDAVPLSSAGNIRLLDAVDEVLASGRGSPGLAEVLARSGVQWVVVRNDLAGVARPPRPVLVHQALDRSPGIEFRTGFGPVLPPFRSGQEVADDGLQQPYTPVEVWQVTEATGRQVLTRSAQGVREVVGGPEALLAISEAGILGEHAAVLAGAPRPSQVEADVIVTDTYRRTEVDFGQVRDNRSATLRASDEFELERRVRDYYPVDPDGRQPDAQQRGYAVSASSSGSSVTALRMRQPSSQPWSAVDGDPETAWVSGDLRPGVGQWWEIAWDEPVVVDRLLASFVVGSVTGAEPSTVVVTTDAGQVKTSVRATDRRQPLQVVAGSTRVLRISLASVKDGTDGDAFGISEVAIPGVETSRPVAVPGSHDAAAIVLTARRGERYGCVHSSREVQCSRRLPIAGEERAGIDRVVSLDAPGTYQVRVTAQPRPGLALERLLAPPGRTTVSSSSRLVADPLAGPPALVDGDARTAWLADPLDPLPTVRIGLAENREVTGVSVEVPPELAASRPLGVTVRSESGERTGYLDSSGTLSFAPLRGLDFEVTFGLSSRFVSRDPLTGATAALPIGMAELRLSGAEDLMEEARPLEAVGVPCGFGPEVKIDGTAQVDTSISAPSQLVLSTQLVSASTCRGGTITLSPGRHRITVDSTEEFLVEQLELVQTGVSAEGAAPMEQPEVVQWGPTDRRLRMTASTTPRILETTENYNDAWRASMGSTILEPMQVDGWRQAWLVPAGLGGEVRLQFVPQPWYQAGLAAGSAAALGLLGLLVVPARAGARRRTDQSRNPRTTLARPALWTSVPVLIASLAAAGLLGVLVVGACWWWSWRRPAARLGTVLVAWSISVAVAVALPWPAVLSVPDPVLAIATAAALVAFVTAALPGPRGTPHGTPRWWPDTLRLTTSREST